MATVYANALWFFQDGTSTDDSITSIVRGVDTALITDADLTADGVELLCCEGISPNINVNKEDVYCPQRSGTPLTGTASYGLDASPTLDSKTELVATFSEATRRMWQLFYSTGEITNGTAIQVQSGSAELSGLVLLNHYDSNDGGAQKVRSWFWTEMTLTGMNLDRAVSKPQLTMNLLRNGSNSPVTTTGVS